MNQTILHQMIAKSPRLSDATKKSYLVNVDRWIAFAGVDPTRWTRYLMQTFYAELLKEMKSQSANRVVMALRYAASWWATMESKPELDFTRIELAQGSARAQRRALTPAEATQLIQQASAQPTPRNLRDLALIVVGLDTGMRRSSLVDMAIERTVTHGTSAIGAFAEVAIKGQQDRYKVPLSKTAVAALHPWLAWLAEHTVRDGATFRGLLNRVERDEVISDGISDRQIYNIVDELAQEAGIKRQIHPHLFRHSFVTWRLEAEVDPWIIAVTTGHRRGSDRGTKMGAMGGYMTEDRLYDLARATTPPWLSELVEKEISKR